MLGMQSPSGAFPSQLRLVSVCSPCCLGEGLTKAQLPPLGEHWGSHESHRSSKCATKSLLEKSVPLLRKGWFFILGRK